jgi:D-proline reductase (dithiol) PrdB
MTTTQARKTSIRTYVPEIDKFRPVSYIDKTRDYYLLEGYDNPYQYAHFDDVPFTRLTKPLAECRVGLVSTSDIAMRAEDGVEITRADLSPNGDGRTSVYSIPSSTPTERLFTKTWKYDEDTTHLDDVDTYFPITRMRECVEEGRIGSLAARLHGVGTQYSQRRTLEYDAPEVLRMCREDAVDIALLTPV